MNYYVFFNIKIGEMDFVQNVEDLLVIASTSNTGPIDPLMKKQGRFEKVVRIPLPNLQRRK
jgi:SpoVK/Ycf46/Vps4 family AAA+-type ATPase